MISLVTTVFNDLSGIRKFFAMMAAQTRPPDEIAIVDAGSTDGTWAAIESEMQLTNRPWRLVAKIDPRCNVARGRNLAIEMAEGPIIVSTDIGCDWDVEWIEELTRPLLENDETELVIGSWAVDPEGLEGPWAKTELALKGEQTFSASNEIACSSRSVAYRKTLWQAIGGYPEDLTLAADDAVFDILLEKAQVRHAPAPKIRCYWHRHSTFKAFMKEQFRYGLGDGEAAIRRRDFLLTGSRMVLEGLGFLGLLAMPFLSGVPRLFCVILLLTSIGLWLLRLKSLLPARRRLSDLGVSKPMLRLIRFVYGSKLYWLRGYIKGWLRGSKMCRKCRLRISEMSPDRYGEALRDLQDGRDLA
jgi:glycosyltransferase involved in cell wall biosynthesis